MKNRLLSIFLVLSLLVCALPAGAEDLSHRTVADGHVAAAQFVDVIAPFSGTLRSFDLAMGDAVKAGDQLFEYVTTTVYAPEDGTVRAVFASLYDSAEAVMSRYGAVMGIEPVKQKVINATVASAYDDAARLIHLGETLYFHTGSTDGMGRVTYVTGSTYQVEILEGSFDLGKNLSLYRADDYAQKNCVGAGSVARREDAMVQGAGRIVTLFVQEGDSVKMGDALFEAVSPDAAPDVKSADVVCPSDGVIASVAVQPGQQVWKGEVLCRVYLTSDIEITAEVDEMDVGTLRVGDTLPVTLDMAKDNVLTGTVTEISACGVTRQNASYFTVHLSLPQGSYPLGASASVYLPEK